MEELNELKQAAIDQPAREKKKKRTEKNTRKKFRRTKRDIVNFSGTKFWTLKKKFP